MAKRVLIGGLFHETHTLVEDRTGIDKFEIRRGAELLASAGDASPLAGVVETGQELGWEMIPAIDMRVMPSGMVTDEAVEQWWSEFKPVAEQALRVGLDGVYLVLHGAMVSASCFDVEGEMLERFAKLAGAHTVPVGGVTDLHANFTQRMADFSQGLVTYRENPHIDAKESAVRAARLLDRVMQRGERPATLYQHPPLMWPPTGTATADEPMRSLERMAREIEAHHPDILVVNVHAGFSFADIPETGVSFSVVTVGDKNEARAALNRLSAYAVEHRAKGNALEPPIEQVMPKLQEFTEGPIILVEPSDNIGGGAPGDGAGVLKALVQHEIDNAAVIINDAEAVATVSKLAPGARTTLSMGGKGSRLSGGPATLEVELVSTSDGKFDLEDRNSHLASLAGAHIDMGPSAVVRHKGIQILLTTHKTAPFDLGQLRSQGIIPEKLFAIGVKAAVAHRRAYDPITKVSFYVGTPGPCSSDLKSLPLRHVARPIYPLDD